jgi:hypothetical protein
MRIPHVLQFLFAHFEIEHMWSVKESSKIFCRDTWQSFILTGVLIPKLMIWRLYKCHIFHVIVFKMVSPIMAPPYPHPRAVNLTNLILYYVRKRPYKFQLSHQVVPKKILYLFPIYTHVKTLSPFVALCNSWGHDFTNFILYYIRKHPCKHARQYWRRVGFLSLSEVSP